MHRRIINLTGFATLTSALDFKLQVSLKFVNLLKGQPLDVSEPGNSVTLPESYSIDILPIPPSENVH